MVMVGGFLGCIIRSGPTDDAHLREGTNGSLTHKVDLDNQRTANRILSILTSTFDLS